MLFKKIINSDFKIMKKRILVLFLVSLIITNLITVFFLIFGKTQNAKNPYPFLDISRTYIDQKNFIVNINPLRQKITEIAKKYGENKLSIYIEFLNSGANIAFNSDVRRYPASLIKMPIAIATVKKIEKGEWEWDSELVLASVDVEARYGQLYKDPIGTRYTIEKLMEELLIGSDNTAYLILLRNLGAGAVEEYLTETGLEGLFDKNLDVTAKEYTRIFRSLYTSSYLRRDLSEKILTMLSKVPDDIYLDKGLPDNIVFAHKFGQDSEKKIYADSGIVYIPERPYLITVIYMADNKEPQKEIEKLFTEVSRSAYDYFQKK